MSEVKRYHLYAGLDVHAFAKCEAVLKYCVEDEGVWVMYEDYARLKAEVERLDTFCKQLSKQHSDISCENIMLRKAGDNVVADLEHLTKSGWFNKCKSVKTWLAAKDGKLLK